MIITLKGADFSLSNIGTLSSWRITRSLGTGATYEGVTSVDKGAALTATVTIAEGYELGAAGVTVTMGGTAISAATVDGNVITINIAEVTGNVVIKVPTVNINTGEEDEPEVPDTPSDNVSVLLKDIAGSVLSDTGLKSDTYTTYTGGTEGRTTFMEVPVEPSTFYFVDHAIRIWFLDSTKKTILTINPSSESIPRFYFTTPVNTAYISLTFREELSDGSVLSSDEASLVKITSGYNPTGETVALSAVASSVELNKALSSGGYATNDNDTKNTFKNIPVVAGNTYYIKNAVRVWFLKSNKTTTVGTKNLTTEVAIKHQFTVPDTAAYVSVTVNNTNPDGSAYDANQATMITIA